MVSRSPEQWRALAAQRLLGLLDAEGAVTKPEMEAKLSEEAVGLRPVASAQLVNPHHLTTARARLLAAGEIVRNSDATRGGRPVATFLRASATKQDLRAAGRKRLLHARFLSWSSSSAEWKGAPPIPAALERVIHASLLEAAPHGYRLVRPGGGDVTELLGRPVVGGSLDNAAFYTPLHDGLPRPPVTVVIEAKNLREWVYPHTQELDQVLSKAAQLSVDFPGAWILPVLVCRRMHYTTTRMAKQMGFHGIETRRQYVRPVVAVEGDSRRRFDEVVAELGYDLQPHEGAVPQMVQQFVTTVPKRVDEATRRWREVCAHPAVLPALKMLRDDRLSEDDRHSTLAELKAAVDDVTGEDLPWGSDAE